MRDTRAADILKPCDRNPDHSLNAADGRQFTAFAAGFDKRAVETRCPMADGTASSPTRYFKA